MPSIYTRRNSNHPRHNRRCGGVDKFEDLKKQYCGNLAQFSPDEEAQNKCKEMMDKEMPRINDMLIEHLGVVSKKTYKLNKDYRLPSVYNLWGNYKRSYQVQTASHAYDYLYGVGNNKGTSIYYLKNGASFNGIVYTYNSGNHMALIFDTNGPYKGPNKYGYDIFIWASSGWFYNQRACSFAVRLADDKNAGIGCYYYAARNVNPDDNTKDYWKDFLR